MALKLYKGEVAFQFYFLAEEGEEDAYAESIKRDVISNEVGMSDVDVDEVTDEVDIGDIEDQANYIVYGEHPEDILIQEAFEISVGRPFNS